jgi:hypothetical protein
MSQGFSAGAIKHNPLIIPVNVFSRRDCHFCVSYAVDEAALGRGLDWRALPARREKRPISISTSFRRSQNISERNKNYGGIL